MYYTHNIDPAIFKLFGMFEVRWYGLMYLTGFVVGYFFLKNRHKKLLCALNGFQLQDLITYLMVGMVLGARITYVFVYNWEYYSKNLVEIFYLTKGGLSFHGAAIGFCAAIWLFGRKYKIGFWHIADNVAIVSALGVFFGRLGNFTNGELWGRPTDVAWAVIFPGAGPQPRHPSQIYQSLGEGLCVFLLLLLIDSLERKKQLSIGEKNKKGTTNVQWHRTGVIGSYFLIGYGVARFIVEFYREPDAQLGFYFQYFSMGQILCAIMIVIGVVLVRHRMKVPVSESYSISGS